MKTVYLFWKKSLDEEMKELAKEEMNEAKASIPKMEEELKILLLPKDENDDKNVVVEIEAVPAVTRRRCLRQNFTECTACMQRRKSGRRK